MTSAAEIPLDVAIVGGGIAGLWLLTLLHGRGYRAVLFEADAIGAGQTLSSQGIIHGGLKYALNGKLSVASEAIAGMPGRWRACLTGTGEVDLTGVALLCEHYHLFADATTIGRLTAFFASRSLRGRVANVPEEKWPESLRGARATVYALEDFVVGTPDLLAKLHQRVNHLCYRHTILPGALRNTDNGWVLSLPGQTVKTRTLVLAAGAGNGELLKSMGVAGPQMQLRPLQQVIVRHPALTPLYAHCLTGISRPEPRLTITSHPETDNCLWYLGGQLASDGANMSADELERHARRELAACLPWMNWDNARISTLSANRAEISRRDGRRPDEASATKQDNLIVCWPTKLSLVPDLGDRVLALLEPPQESTLPAGSLGLPPVTIGREPWGS